MNNLKLSKIKEETFLTNNKNEIEARIDIILEKHEKELENEKVSLQQKYNIRYYIEKAESLKIENDSLKKDLKNLLKQYGQYSSIIAEREKKLYLEVFILFVKNRI